MDLSFLGLLFILFLGIGFLDLALLKGLDLTAL